MKSLALAVVGAAALAATLAPSSQARFVSILGCTKQVTIHGHHAIRFCGPASATTHVGRRSQRIRGGSCVRVNRHFYLNVGISGVDPTVVKPTPSWLNISTTGPAHSGSQPASISLVFGGRSYAVTSGTVTLSRRLRRGTFNGLTGPNLFNEDVTVSGAFNC